MQPILVERNTASQGILSSGSFGLSSGNEAHIFGILRNTLYSAKELAVLREYSTNAWDAHVDAGLGDMPIKISLPTTLAPELVIRDYGRGLSATDVFEVYAQYGASTKRASNNTVGYMGIGSKSAFAYSEAFTIISFHGGVKSVYAAYIDESNVGRVNKLHEEVCGGETGVEIRIPVIAADIPAFHREAETLFPFFRPLPKLNIAIKPHEFTMSSGSLRPSTSNGKGWVAVMGCVPYRLDLTKMQTEIDVAGLKQIAEMRNGCLHFDIGEISVSASREEVEYTARTRAAVVQRLQMLFEELLAEFSKIIENPASTPWEKLLAAQNFTITTHLSVPPRFAEWRKDKITLYTIKPVEDTRGNVVRDARGDTVYTGPKTFRLHGFRYRKGRSGVSSPNSRITRPAEWSDIEIHRDTRLLIQDDLKRGIRGYHLKKHDHIVVPEPKQTTPAVEAELLTYVTREGITGIPTALLSTLPHDVKPPQPRTPRVPSNNPRHNSQQFVFNPNPPRTRDNWDPIKRTPIKEDVFVVLSRFEVQGVPHFSFQESKDRGIIEFLGGKVPPIYGYKTSIRAPVNQADVVGTPYTCWRDAEIQQRLSDPQVQRQLEDRCWAHILRRSDIGEIHTILSQTFAANHPLVVLTASHLDAKNRNEALPSATKQGITDLLEHLGKRVWGADEHLAHILRRYPLLDPSVGGPGVAIFASNRRVPWLHYINLIDREIPL